MRRTQNNQGWLFLMVVALLLLNGLTLIKLTQTTHELRALKGEIEIVRFDVAGLDDMLEHVGDFMDDIDVAINKIIPEERPKIRFLD